jgi:hypothetical protein
MRLIIVEAVVLISLVGACSSSSGNTANREAGADSGTSPSIDPVTGAVDGTGLAVASSTAVVGASAALTGTSEHILLVGFSSASGGNCSTLQSSDVQIANATGLAILVVSNTPIELTTYKVAPGNGATPTLPAATAFFSPTNSMCVNELDAGSAAANSGTVKVTALSDSSIEGTYDLTFSGGSLRGSFTTPVCSGINLDAIFINDRSDASAPCEPQ